MKTVNNKNILNYAIKSTYCDSKYTTQGKSYKLIKILYLITIAYTIVMNAAVIIAQALSINEYLGKEQTNKVIEYLANTKTVLVLVVLVTILLIIAVVFVLKKIVIGFALCNVAACTIGFGVFRYAMSVSIDRFGSMKFWTRHGVPIVLVAVFALILILILLNEKYKIRKNYTFICNSLYKEFANNVNLTDEEFIDILDKYDGHRLML